MRGVVEVIDTRLLSCGEGPVWNSHKDKLYWTDSDGELILCKAADKPTEIVKEGIHASSLTFHEDGGLVISNKDGFFHLSESGVLAVISTTCNGLPLADINDIIADPEGRLFGGQETFHDDREYEPGFLYRVDLDGSTQIVEEGLHISNGMGFNPALNTFYLADTITRCVYAYDYDLASGVISRRRTLVNVPREDGMPDGLTIDREGFLWVAMFLGGQICRYDPEGTLERRIGLPVAQPTSLTFGGREYNELYITSASAYWQSSLAPKGHDYSAPRGGPLFRIKLDIEGRPEFKAKTRIEK